MSVVGAIGRLSNSGATPASYQVTRRAPDSYSSTGKLQLGATSTLIMTASIQPYSGIGLKVLPEGFRSEDVVEIYTTTALRSTPGGPDEVKFQGEVYVVFDVKGPWTLRGGTHYVATAAKKSVAG